MPANARNREVLRDEVAAGLNTLLVAAGAGPVKAVYNHKKGKITGESPVVMVLSLGISREQWGQGTSKYRSKPALEVLVFVADAETMKTPEWTDEAVEDRLDLIEKMIADWVADNRTGASYKYLEHSGRSEIFAVSIGGKPWTMERIVLEADVFDA